MDADAITAISLGLSKLKNLRTLKINVGCNFLKDAGATCLLAYLTKLNDLLSLTLDLR